MMYRKLLVTGTLSTLLLVPSLSAEVKCTGDACYISLKNLKQTKVIQNKSEFKHYSSTEMDKDKSFDIVVDGKITIVFPSYVMTEKEKINYYKNQKINRDLQRVIKPVENIEDKFLNKNLPTSEYFCDSDKKPVRVKNSNLYECV